MHLEIPGPAGALEALLDDGRSNLPGSTPIPRTAIQSTRSELERPEPASVTPRAGVVFAHPHPNQGGTMHTKAVFQGAKGLARIGCAVLRFNFRGVGRSAGQFDEGRQRASGASAGQGRGEMGDYQAALDWMAARYPGIPLWAAGFSFGAWVGLETGAADPRVSVLIAIAPPVNRSGYSFPHTLESAKPKFLIQGDLDELCPLKDMWAFYAKLKEPKELVVINGATHLFEGKTEEVGDALAELLGDFE